MRLFVAVDVESDEIKTVASNIQKFIRNTGVRATYPKLDDLHITLKFLGDVDKAFISDIVERLTNEKLGEIKINIRDVGGFPNLSRPRVIFLDVYDDDGKLKVLHEFVESRLESMFPRDSRPFKPHITVARIKQFYKLDKQAINLIKSMVDNVWVEITSFKLKESILTNSGPIYKDVAVFNLV
ncbi:MAG TPA: RNA 2',3'-cyclic phosphodiesterase [Thermoprotei archaeon]|nr:RNA 2',3'-cyclic phosphodiesterase [Thermoprotei archaeon]